MTKLRQFERVDCRTEAEINHNGRTIKGEVENLSLKGLFVKTAEKIGVDEQVAVTVFFSGNSGQFSFSLKGKVVHSSENGLGINFQKIDVDSLVHTMNAPGDATAEEISGFCSCLGEGCEAEKLSA